MSKIASGIAKKVREARLPRFPMYKPSTSLTIFLLIAVSIFILGGGVYDIMEKPLTVLPTPSNPIFYYPGMTDQLLNESLIFSLFLVMGIGGGFVAYRSTRYAYRPREAKMLLLIGVSLMLVAFLGCEILMTWKGV